MKYLVLALAAILVAVSIAKRGKAKGTVNRYDPSDESWKSNKRAKNYDAAGNRIDPCRDVWVYDPKANNGRGGFAKVNHVSK